MLAEVGRRLAGGPVAVVAVRGLGGMGKSQVALEYAHRMRAFWPVPGGGVGAGGFRGDGGRGSGGDGAAAGTCRRWACR